MSEYTESIIEKMMFGTSPKRRRVTFQKGSGENKWRTGTGEVINMKDMTLDHLWNTLEYCEKTGNTGKAHDLRKELKRRFNPQ